MSKKGMKELQRKDFPSKRFDPFRRTDRYGPRGTTPQPPLEVARCVLVALALAPLKLLVTLSAVVFFYFVCRFSPVLFPDENRRARVVTSLGRRCSRLALLGLGFVSVRYEDVAADELPDNYPSSPPVDEDDDDEGDDLEGDDDDEDVGVGDRNGGLASSSAAANGDARTRRRRKGSSSRRKTSSSTTPLAAGAIVSNHCGWIDVLVHMAAPPYPLKIKKSSSSKSTSSSTQPPPSSSSLLFSSFPSFVARASTADLPLIGVISKAIGCLYVDRSKTAGASGIAALVRERVAAAAEAGRRAAKRGKKSNAKASNSVLWPPPLLLFPEGTTTNGRYLLRFKTGAFLAGCPVAPVLLSYGPSPGFKFNPSWESIAAGRHAALLLAQPWLTAVVRRLPPYHPSAAERRDPALFASKVRETMLCAGDWAPSDSTIADKWEYQALLQGKPPRPPPPPIQSGGAAATKAAAVLSSDGNGGGKASPSPSSKAATTAASAVRKGRGNAVASSVRATSGGEGGGAPAAPPAVKRLET